MARFRPYQPLLGKGGRRFWRAFNSSCETYRIAKPDMCSIHPARHRHPEQNSMRPSGMDSNTRTHYGRNRSTSHLIQHCPSWTGRLVPDQRTTDIRLPKHNGIGTQLLGLLQKSDPATCPRWHTRWLRQCGQSAHDRDWVPVVALHSVRALPWAQGVASQRVDLHRHTSVRRYEEEQRHRAQCVFGHNKVSRCAWCRLARL